MRWLEATAIGLVMAAAGFAYGRLGVEPERANSQPPAQISEAPVEKAVSLPCSPAPEPSRALPVSAPPEPEKAPARAPRIERSAPRPERRPRTLLGGIRIAGIRPDGGAVLGHVAPGSLMDLLGLRTGDEIFTLNGHKTTEPAGVLKAYSELRTTDRWVARIFRQGKGMEITYVIR